jgi:hypothetical protein
MIAFSLNLAGVQFNRVLWLSDFRCLPVQLSRDEKALLVVWGDDDDKVLREDLVSIVQRFWRVGMPDLRTRSFERDSERGFGLWRRFSDVCTRHDSALELPIRPRIAGQHRRGWRYLAHTAESVAGQE